MQDGSKQQIDPRIIRTRQLIKEAFIDLVQEMDIEKLTISKIADRATINRVTFYLHYRNIPDMLDKMADEMVEEIRHVLNQDAADDENWMLLVKLLEHIAEHAKFFKVILGWRRPPIFTERLLNLLTELITARIEVKGTDSLVYKLDIQKDIAIWHGSSALIGTIVSWLRNDMPYTPAFLAKQFMMINNHGLYSKP